MIRVASAEDVDAVVAIERSCFGANAWSPQLVADAIAGDRHTVLVTDDGRAYAAISLAGDVADLDRIAVVPEARGEGRARDLLDHVLDTARDLGAARLLLEVAADNAAAIALYESSGFETIGRRDGYYPGGVDALVMELTIHEWR